jgi:hypothetical protein
MPRRKSRAAAKKGKSKVGDYLDSMTPQELAAEANAVLGKSIPMANNFAQEYAKREIRNALAKQTRASRDRQMHATRAMRAAALQQQAAATQQEAAIQAALMFQQQRAIEKKLKEAGLEHLLQPSPAAQMLAARLATPKPQMQAPTWDMYSSDEAIRRACECVEESGQANVCYVSKTGQNRDPECMKAEVQHPAAYKKLVGKNWLWQGGQYYRNCDPAFDVHCPEDSSITKSRILRPVFTAGAATIPLAALSGYPLALPAALAAGAGAGIVANMLPSQKDIMRAAARYI